MDSIPAPIVPIVSSTDTSRRISPLVFLYGTLAEPKFLGDLLSLPKDETPVFNAATFFEGVVKTWQGTYTALTDGTDDEPVYMSAYIVTSKEREKALLFYESDNYEVVRCGIEVESEIVQQLTFRFVGPCDLHWSS